MFGYATDETPDLMPATLYYSHKILETMAADRHSGAAPFLEAGCQEPGHARIRERTPGPGDGARRVDPACTGLFLSRQRGRPCEVCEVLRDYVVGVFQPCPCPTASSPKTTRIYVNPTGRFEIGGPDGDAGAHRAQDHRRHLWRCVSPHGGGAFSGKDPTKVDRSAAYITRYMAKNIVAAGLARRVTIQLSYAIGVSEPLSLYVDTHGTGTVPEATIEAVLADASSA